MLATLWIKLLVVFAFGWLRPEGVPAPLSPRETASLHAVQTMYRAGVPHTDTRGRLRHAYDSASFLPRCIYHAIPGSFQQVRDAGFNCAHTYEQYGVDEVIEELRAAGLQLIKHWPTDPEVARYKSDPNLLGWYLDEEPTHQIFLEMVRTGNRDLMGDRYEAYLARRAAIRAIDPHHPIFPLESGWIPPGMRHWWETWNRAGDVVVYDHYPLEPKTTDIEIFAKRVSAAARLNRESKPLWLTVQAYGSAGGALPTAEQLRGMVFTALIHGATGIIYFAYDSWVTRAWDVVGMGPETPLSQGRYYAATPEEAGQSRALWAGAATLNTELTRLAPRLLSPTADLPYSVYFAGKSATGSPIRTMLKHGEGAYTLFASNIESRSVDGRFQFPGRIHSVRRVAQDGSSVGLRVEGGSFRDSFEGYGVKVYEIRLTS